MLKNQRNLFFVIILFVVILFVLVISGLFSEPQPRIPTPPATLLGNNPIEPTAVGDIEQPTPTILAATETPPSEAVTEPAAPTALTLAVDNLLNSYVQSGSFSGSVLIAQNGQILFSKGYGLADQNAGTTNTPQTKYRIGSVTKQFTAVAILLLQEQGKLTVEDPLCIYLSTCPPAWQSITIHQLLTHTSGIPDLTSFPDFQSSRATPSPPLETLNRFIDRPLDFPSGSRWQYSNSGYIVLGLVVEGAAGQSYEGFLQENIFTPLQMTSSGYDHNSNELAVGYAGNSQADFIDMSIPYAAGALYSTSEDLYRWNQGLFNGNLLTQDSVTAMVTEYAPIPGPQPSAYGYGWIIGQSNDHRVYQHRGAIEGFVAFNAYLPNDQMSIILLSNQQATPLNRLYDSLFNEVISNS